MGRLLRGIAASALALAVTLPGAAPPAQAEGDGGISDEIIDAALTAIRIYRAGGSTPDDVVLLVRQVLAAISGVENEVVGHIDGNEASTVLAYAREVSREMRDYAQIRDNEILLYEFGRDLNGYSAYAYEKYRFVSSHTAKDQIGLAAQAIFSVTLVVREDAGATNGLAQIEADYVDLNRRIVAELKPVCTARPGELDDHPMIDDVEYECVAANGEKAYGHDYRVGDRWISGPVDVEALRLESAINSSWAVAKEVLEGLDP